MSLQERDRERLETALDRLWDIASEHCDGRQLVQASDLYCRAVAIVRERPDGARRVRSDFNQKRPTPNGELPV